MNHWLFQYLFYIMQAASSCEIASEFHRPLVLTENPDDGWLEGVHFGLKVLPLYLLCSLCRLKQTYIDPAFLNGMGGYWPKQTCQLSQFCCESHDFLTFLMASRQDSPSHRFFGNITLK